MSDDAAIAPSPTGDTDAASRDAVALTDLEVIQRWSLAVRSARADRAEVVAALRADLAWLEDSVRTRAPRSAAKAGAARGAARGAAKKAAAKSSRSGSGRTATRR